MEWGAGEALGSAGLANDSEAGSGVASGFYVVIDGQNALGDSQRGANASLVSFRLSTLVR
jgi:hypothetical protein